MSGRPRRPRTSEKVTTVGKTGKDRHRNVFCPTPFCILRFEFIGSKGLEMLIL